MIIGKFNKRGSPIIRARVQVIDQDDNPEGTEILVDFTMATGAKGSVLGPRDSDRTQVNVSEKPPVKVSPYWLYDRKVTREVRVRMMFEDDWDEQPLILNIAAADPNDRSNDDASKPILGMDVLRYWDIVMDAKNNVLCAVRGTGGTTPPKSKATPEDEPVHIDQAFTMSMSQINEKQLRMNGEDFRRVAETMVGLEGIHRYHPGHKQGALRTQIRQVDIEMVASAYTSAVGRLQLWMAANLPGTPDQLIATSRLSWGDWSEGGNRTHKRILGEMADMAHREAGAGPQSQPDGA